MAAGQNKFLVNKIKKAIGLEGTIQTRFGRLKNIAPEKPYYNNTPYPDWVIHLTDLLRQPIEKTPQRTKIYVDIISKIPSKLNDQESIDTLEMLSMIVDRTWADKIKSNLPHLMGVINHCIDQLNKATGLSWYDLLGVYGEKIKPMLEKLKEAALHDQLLTPDTVTS